MPAFDFPANPTNGQKYTPVGGPTYEWNGAAWTVPAGVGATYTDKQVLVGDGTATPKGDAGLTYDAATDNLAVAGTVAMGSAFAFRNKIINGGMDIWQRGDGPYTSNGYTADRWTIFSTGGVFDITKQNEATASGQAAPGLYNFMRVTRTGPVGLLYVTQKLEDVALYSGKTVTVSFYARANTNITLPVRLMQEFGTGGSSTVTVGSVNTNITSSWGRYSATFTIPSLSGKTLGAGSYLECSFDTPDTYSSLDITGVQLEEGTVATPFEHRPIGLELQLCQRYYSTGRQYTRAHAGANESVSNWVTFPVTMRVGPTVSLTNEWVNGYVPASTAVDIFPDGFQAVRAKDGSTGAGGFADIFVAVAEL